MEIRNTRQSNHQLWTGPRSLLLARSTALVWLMLLDSTGLLIAIKRRVEHQIVLPTSKLLIVPTPGRIGSVNGFPATLVLSPDERYAALLNDGYGTEESQAYQSITIFDMKTNQITDFPEARLPPEAHQSYFLGLAFSSDGSHLYASIGSLTDPTGDKPGDTGNGIAVYSFREGKVAPDRFIKIAPQKIARSKGTASGVSKTGDRTAIPYPAGIAVISRPDETTANDELLVANNLSDNVVLLDTATGRILEQFDLSAYDTIPSSFPYTVVATHDGRRAWCSLWNLSRVAELDLVKGTVVRWISLLEPDDPIAPGSHPTALLLSRDESLLYVALSNADRVAVVMTDSGETVRFLDTAVPRQKYAGTCPSALAQTADGKLLFVADSSINAVAVFKASNFRPYGTASRSAIEPALGFIPTDWYPTALASSRDDLLIAAAKGQGTGPNNHDGTLEWERTLHEPAYIASLLAGSIARLNVPDMLANLDEFTRRVEQDNFFDADPGMIRFAQGTSPIRHVIYIIKENRTYDQILGDLNVGNGDPSLTLYGADVTPNQHKLALQFGVLDQFYDSGEVSGDGHLWSTAAITTDYNEKTWQIAYRGLEHTSDSMGFVAGEIPLEHLQPDVDDPSTGFLWDNVARHALTYRDYGEFVHSLWCQPKGRDTVSGRTGTVNQPSATCTRPAVNKGEPLPLNVGNPHGAASPWPWAIPVLSHANPTKAILRDHCDPHFPGFNTDYPDQLRTDEFLNEFDGFVHALDEGKGLVLPAFVLMALPNDHTHGTTPGKPRPAALVADNDLAVGRIVEAVSHSPYWKDTAIFIVEDDAQDGPDHVDAHRSTALVISKYSPGSAEDPFVDHRFYTTVNMVHTIETLLALPAMNQNDAYAAVMASLFSGPGNQRSFSADWSNRDNGLIYQTNPIDGQGTRESERMDFAHPDAANPTVLNAILWRDRKGNAPMPLPKQTVLAQEGISADERPIADLAAILMGRGPFVTVPKVDRSSAARFRRGD
jgi:DNA-binding beta-propeller fold protein YncE